MPDRVNRKCVRTPSHWFRVWLPQRSNPRHLLSSPSSGPPRLCVLLPIASANLCSSSHWLTCSCLLAMHTRFPLIPLCSLLDAIREFWIVCALLGLLGAILPLPHASTAKLSCSVPEWSCSTLTLKTTPRALLCVANKREKERGTNELEHQLLGRSPLQYLNSFSLTLFFLFLFPACLSLSLKVCASGSSRLLVDRLPRHAPRPPREPLSLSLTSGSLSQTVSIPISYNNRLLVISFLPRPPHPTLPAPPPNFGASASLRSSLHL